MYIEEREENEMKAKQIIPVAVPTYAVWEEDWNEGHAYGVSKVHYLALMDEGDDCDCLVPVINLRDGYYDYDVSTWNVYEEDVYKWWRANQAEFPVIEYFGNQIPTTEEIAARILKARESHDRRTT